MNYPNEGIRVGPTQYGLGGFALRSFSAGEYLGPIPGEIIVDPEYGSDYGIDLGNATLEPAAPFRFLNHSCQPNCVLVISEEEDEDGAPCDPTVWLEVLGEIEPGQQMTIDYAWPADAAIPCLCGAANCRGWIVAEDLLDQVPGGQGSLVDRAPW